MAIRAPPPYRSPGAAVEAEKGEGEGEGRSSGQSDVLLGPNQKLTKLTKYPVCAKATCKPVSRSLHPCF